MELIHRPVDELIVIKDKERSIQAVERELDAVTFEAPEAMRMAASFQEQDAQLRMGHLGGVTSFLDLIHWGL